MNIDLSNHKKETPYLDIKLDYKDMIENSNLK